MPLRDDLLAPIPGAHPAGPYLRYDPVYDKIKEARREDLDAPQGDYQTALKTADWPLVIKLASETIATRSKDLQLAVWLVEAALKREGFAGLREGLDLLRGLIKTFWDDLHPELEDGDAEMRAAPLEWLGRYLEASVRLVPLTRGGLTALDYRESRAVGYEEDAKGDYDLHDAYKAAVAAGKVSADAFDQDFSATPKEWLRDIVANIDGCLESLEELDRAADERFGSDAPSFIKLRQVLQEVRQTASQLLARKLEGDPDPVEAGATIGETVLGEGVGFAAEAPVAPRGGGGADAPPAGGAPAAGGVSGIAIAAVPRSREEAGGRIAAAARFLRGESPADPGPFLLLRGFRWGELRADGGRPNPRLLSAPPTEVRSGLKQLLLEEQWAQLLEAAEDVMATPFGRGWLDLQRYTMTACEGLGEEYASVAAAVRSALRSLLHDLPWLPGATLMDDTPTANPDTLAWLHGEGLLGSPAAAPADAGDDGAPPRVRLAVRRDVTDRAEELLRARQPERAIEVLMQAASQEQSERARFLRRLEAARIMVDRGYAAVAQPLLQEMSEQIERHSLEQWEARETVAQPLGLLYQCRKQSDGGYSGVEELFLRVSRLDPLLGIQLSAKGNGDSNG
jgi:type VI secretion system protein ImpA